MSLQITGTIKKVLPSETGTGSKEQWVKAPFILTTEGQYPKDIYFEAWGKASEVVNQLKPGLQVTVFFNLESREYNNRWYTTPRAWKVEEQGNKTSGPSNSTEAPANEEDDLPF